LGIIYQHEEISINYFSPNIATQVREWNLIAVGMIFNKDDDTSTVTLRSGAFGQIGEVVFDGAFVDAITNLHKLGAELDIVNEAYSLANGFTGFVWKFCVLSLYQSYIGSEIGDDCGEGYCTVCPMTPCIIDCEVDEWLDGTTCSSCRSDCETCVRGENCAPCIDPECGDCLFWDNCDGCISNANNIADCKCNDGYTYDWSSAICIECFTGCKDCLDGTNMSCTECKVGHYLQYNTFTCLLDCPTNFTPNVNS